MYSDLAVFDLQIFNQNTYVMSFNKLKAPLAAARGADKMEIHPIH